MKYQTAHKKFIQDKGIGYLNLEYYQVILNVPDNDMPIELEH